MGVRQRYSRVVQPTSASTLVYEERHGSLVIRVRRLVGRRRHTLNLGELLDEPTDVLPIGSELKARRRALHHLKAPGTDLAGFVQQRGLVPQHPPGLNLSDLPRHVEVGVAEVDHVGGLFKTRNPLHVREVKRRLGRSFANI